MMRTSCQQRCGRNREEAGPNLHVSLRHISAIPVAFLIGIVVLGTLFTTFSPATYAHTEKPNKDLKPAIQAPEAAASKTWYFAEGSVGGSFREFLSLFNPNTTPATVTVTYLFQNGSPRAFTHTVNALSRGTVNANDDLKIAPEAAQQSISAIVQANLPIVAERPMYFTYKGISSGTDVLGATNANSSTFFFAAADSTGGYATFISILNPSTTNTAHVVIRYYSGGGLSALQSLDIAPMHRGTGSPGSAGIFKKVAVKVASDIGIVVERPMYFSTNIPTAGGATSGAASAVGVAGPGSDWLFAEGYTGPNFQEYLVLANFTYSDSVANVKLEYTNGSVQTVPVTVKALSQFFFDVNNAYAHPLPGSTPTTTVSAEVTSSTPSIVAERQMYFHYGAQLIPGGTDVVGEPGPAGHSLYNFAEGYITGNFNEFLAIQNPTGNTEAASITLYINNTTKQVNQQLPPFSRTTLGINGLVGPITATVSISVQVSSGVIVAERPIYFILRDSKGGTDVIGFTGDPSADVSPCAPVQPVSSTEIVIGNTSKKQVALTFDAGGDVAPASTILSILNKRGVHATWFFTGEWAQQNPTVVSGVASGGYEIGNHTMTHPNLTTIADTEICRQLNQANGVITSLSGRPTTRPYYRPPYGARNDYVRQVAANIGYRTVIWTIDTLDWQTNSTPARIIQIITSQLTNGAIILMHAGSSSEAQALDSVITMLQGKGYQLVTLSEDLQ
jgi:peptidoglycan/xylan/chitin deacetylase (PgdA/CDA1 family)